MNSWNERYASVYIIRHPRTLEPVYVGSSMHPWFRVGQHRVRRNNPALQDWLKLIGVAPNVKLLPKLERSKAIDFEGQLTKRLHARGKTLFNRVIRKT